MTKEINNNESTLKDKIAPAVGLLAGALAYKYFRKPKITNPIQQAAKGKLTWISDAHEKSTLFPKTLKEKIKRQYQYGDIELLDANKKMPKRIEGATYTDVDAFTKQKHKLPKSDAGLNAHSASIAETFQNKLNFSRLKSQGSIEKAKPLTSVVKSEGYDNFVKETVNLKGKYIKPNIDFASGGESHFSSKTLKKARKKINSGEGLSKSENKDFKHLYDERDNYIVQKNIKYDKIKAVMPDKPKHKLTQKLKDIVDYNAGKPKSERRVNFIVNKGEVVPVSSYKRWHSVGGLNPFAKANTDVKFNSDTKKELEYIIKNNRQLRSTKNSYVLGADVLRDKNNKLKIVEVNDQSGYLDPTIMWQPFSAHKLYKATTGRDTKVISGLKGISAGAGATAGTQLLINKNQDKKN